jgi:choline kinase
VKVLLLAAGAGSRMKNFQKLPKPLIQVKGKPLLWWSAKSFHELITDGTLTSEDFFVVILEKHKSEFFENQVLKEFFKERNPYITLATPTSGPAETAVLAINKLMKLNLVNPNEKIVISDSDHFIQSLGISRTINQDADVYLWEAKKDDSLEWSFLLTQTKPKIVEKPKTTEGINVKRGLIGVYGFKDCGEFVNRATTLLDNPIQEVFLSDVVNSFLQDEKRVSIGHVDKFFPMGSPDQLKELKNLPDPLFAIFDSPTFFIDIDGVLLHHNDSVHGSYPWDEDQPLVENIKQINKLFNEAKIVIVSARPKKHESEVINRLNSFGILYDELLLGCTGGQRILVNDLKPRAPFISTAIAVNSIRDEQAPIERKKVKYTNFSGGSGAISVLVEEDDSPPVVIKYSQDPQLRKTLDYQVNWFRYMENFEKIRVPKVVKIFDGSDGFYGYSTSKFENLVSFYTYTQSEMSIEKRIHPLIDGLGPLYSANDYPAVTDPNLLEEIIREKVIPSIKTVSLNFADYSILRELLMRLLDEFNILKSNAKNQELIFKGPQAIIHGDPTFENLQFSE